MIPWMIFSANVSSVFMVWLLPHCHSIYFPSLMESKSDMVEFRDLLVDAMAHLLKLVDAALELLESNKVKQLMLVSPALIVVIACFAIWNLSWCMRSVALKVLISQKSSCKIYSVLFFWSSLQCTLVFMYFFLL